jgi:hypothetical protein
MISAFIGLMVLVSGHTMALSTIGTLETYNSREVEVVGDRAYTAESVDRLIIVDVSDPPPRSKSKWWATTPIWPISTLGCCGEEHCGVGCQGRVDPVPRFFPHAGRRPCCLGLGSPMNRVLPVRKTAREVS